MRVIAIDNENIIVTRAIKVYWLIIWMMIVELLWMMIVELPWMMIVELLWIMIIELLRNNKICVAIYNN